MRTDLDPEIVVLDNLCEISIAARKTFRGECLCLVEESSPWEAFLGSLLRTKGNSIPGFKTGAGGDIIEKIAARCVVGNKKLQDAILTTPQADEVKVLIFYTQAAELRITCLTIQLEVTKIK